MKRKQRKSLPWFGNVIVIIIKFCEQLLRISPRIINSLKSYIKHSKECFLLFPNTSKLVKKNSPAPRFSNLLLGVWKSKRQSSSCFDPLRRGRLNRSFNIVESVKKCWKLVESNLNWYKLSFNIDSAFSFFLKMLNCVEAAWTLRSSNICPTSFQLLLDECWANVETV